MSTDAGKNPPVSLLARLIGRQRHPLITVGVCLLLFLAPIGAAHLDGVLGDLLRQGQWRPLFLSSAVISYILVVSPRLARTDADVIEAFRPLVLMDDEGFDQLVNEASRVNPVGELLACGLGAAFGVLVGRTWVSDPDVFWLTRYLALSSGLMFGLLGWTIHAAVTGTRLTTRLHRQPLHIDIFDTKPFEPVGRQSLLIALVFVGGIALGMVFAFERESVFAWQNWLVNILLLLVPVLVFFLNMRETHRVLTAEKQRELAAVRRSIRLASRTLMERFAAEEGTGTLGGDISALVAYEQRVQAARTWPYNTAMLRTLFFSFIVPGGAALAQVVFGALF